ncbi:angiogenic factor with G patch and FHA domains 1 isoform X1 [Anopheles funestus]|uniref:angiogenic factor with G patch and FHA domains 1 isoform X1 n=1 Tax=Anopheles funestus TaxID=62324 RepID=UPI0020C74119|nr:angiogenic factor with G patch and FHA domains 1 isoform X1 [Anopheles funestus]
MARKPAHIKLLRITNLYDVTAKQLCLYVQGLHRHIRLQSTRIQRLKKKIHALRLQRKFLSIRNATGKEQLPEVEVEECAPEQADLVEPLDIKAFVDDIKKTAQDVDIQNRYIYEPTSGLYYDPATGYYYNSIYGLHYDGHRGCYLKYNEETKEYDFYSQVIPETMLEPESNAKQKKSKRTDVSREKEATKKTPDSDDSECSRRHSRKRNRKHKKRYRRKHRHRSRSESESSDSSDSVPKRSKKKHKSKRKHRKSSPDVGVKEEGELESSESGDSKSVESVIVVKSSEEHSADSTEQFKTGYKDVAKRYPPSLRIIVQETNIKELKIGSLFIVTCKGGTLGREGNHDVIIPDINVSKKHLQFMYNARKTTYQFVDLGSRNGTLYNGVRVKLNEQQSASDPQNLAHGSVLQLNQTKLLCHVHEGNSTCGKCEPGLLVNAEPVVTPVIVSKITKPVSHKEGLKLLQKRFGLENEKYIGSGEGGNNADYKDRAAVRRKVKGSSNEHEKTQVASLDQSIASNNKGFQMLSKLGWNEGKPLGKNDTGLTEPIALTSNVGTSGLGSQNQLAIGGPHNAQPVDPRRHSIWRKTQERFERSTVFEAESSEETE